MPFKSELGAFFAEHWQFIAFIGGGLAAWWTGKEAQRFKVHNLGKAIEQIQDEIHGIKDDIAAMQKQDGTDAVSAAASIATISTQMTNMAQAVERIERRLDQKADK